MARPFARRPKKPTRPLSSSPMRRSVLVASPVSLLAFLGYWQKGCRQSDGDERLPPPASGARAESLARSRRWTCSLWSEGCVRPFVVRSHRHGRKRHVLALPPRLDRSRGGTSSGAGEVPCRSLVRRPLSVRGYAHGIACDIRLHRDARRRLGPRQGFGATDRLQQCQRSNRNCALRESRRMVSQCETPAGGRFLTAYGEPLRVTLFWCVPHLIHARASRKPAAPRRTSPRRPKTAARERIARLDHI